MDPQRSRTIVSLEETLFAGKKSKWLPLYRRLMARVSGIPGIETTAGRAAITLSLGGIPSSELALIKVAATGLELRLSLHKVQLRSPRLKRLAASVRPAHPKMSHVVMLSKASDLDEELLTWLKAARTGARTSKDKSS